MADVMSAEKRSALMSRIRAKDTTPEMQVRRYLWANGFRYLLHPGKLAGKPDLVLPRWHTAVLVHGCFWHRHEGCSYFRLPKTRTGFWDAKLQRNRSRDAANIAALVESGWRVAVVWECALRSDAEGTGMLLVSWIRTGTKNVQLMECGHLIRKIPLLNRDLRANSKASLPL